MKEEKEMYRHMWMKRMPFSHVENIKSSKRLKEISPKHLANAWNDCSQKKESITEFLFINGVLFCYGVAMYYANFICNSKEA